MSDPQACPPFVPSAVICGHLRLKTVVAGTAFALFAPFCFAASDPLDSLIKRPLFQPDKTASNNTTPAAPSRIEFGGFLVIAGKPEISITDLATGQGYFVGLRDPKAPYFVENLDQNTPAITLRLNGQSVTLRLRQSTEASVSPAAPSATSTQAVINDAGATPEPVPAGRVSSPVANLDSPASEPNRIPRQTLKIPPRADDPK